jgi:Flp pilus assembly pilin Flp
MDTLRSTVGALADWVGRPMPWLQATLARGPAGNEDTEGGQGLAEYALILGLIAVVAIAGLAFLGGEIIALMTDTVGNGFRYVLDLLGL